MPEAVSWSGTPPTPAPISDLKNKDQSLTMISFIPDHRENSRCIRKEDGLGDDAHAEAEEHAAECSIRQLRTEDQRCFRAGAAAVILLPAVAWASASTIWFFSSRCTGGSA